MSTEIRSPQVDGTRTTRLADAQLRLELVDTSDKSVFEPWLQVVTRGFHAEKLSDEALAEQVAGLAYRRTTGVWDEKQHDSIEPVGTVSSWVADLSLPGGRSVDAWAVSQVSVAPTHRRRGVARALLEAELAAASEQGVALAILTVSESTIYGRFGFGPAAFATQLEIDPRRAHWVGTAPGGSVRFIALEEARELMPRIHDLARGAAPGQIDMWSLRWDQIAAVDATGKDRAKKLLAVRFDDAEGNPQGLVLYRVSGGDTDFVKHTIDVELLLSATDDAYAALWRFVLGVDLVSEVRAELRSASEPLRWQVSDQRGIREHVEDHLWLRILDVPEALSARGYQTDGRLGLVVSDSYGYAEGQFVLEVNNGTVSVTPVEDALTDGTATLALSVNELSALYLGGVSATVLAASGRIEEVTANAAAIADQIFHSATEPWLNVWF